MKAILTLENTISKIEHITSEQKTHLRDLLSFETHGAAFMKRKRPLWDGKTHLMKNNGNFPTGLLQIVLKFLIENEIGYTIRDNRIVPEGDEDIGIDIPSDMVPRDYQIEAMNVTDRHTRGIFLMGTGAGKSLTSALIIDKFKVKTLFVVPDTDLKKQIVKFFKDIFPNQVGSNIQSDFPITVETIQKLSRIPAGALNRFQMLITDEFHHSAAKSYLALNTNTPNAYYRYGFTGTFVRTDGKDMVMHGVISNIIYTKRTSDLIYEGYLVPPNIYMVGFKVRGISKYNYKDAYQYITESPDFNQKIADIAVKCIRLKRQTLIIVKNIAHGEYISSLIPDSHFLHGESPDREEIKQKFIDREITCLVATNIFGEGTDIPSIDVYINARLQKTEIQTIQGIGRALRKIPGKEHCAVFDFMISGQKHLKQHSNERLIAYQTEPAFNIIER